MHAQAGEVTRGILPADLLARLQPDPPDGPAVYFLFSGDECVYIGASLDPTNRVGTHEWLGRDFGRVMFLPTAANLLAEEERRYIGIVRPRHNKAGNPERDPDSESWGDKCGARGVVTVAGLFDEGLRDRLDERAKAEGRSRSEVIVRAVRFLLDHAQVEPVETTPKPKAKGGRK